MRDLIRICENYTLNELHTARQTDEYKAAQDMFASGRTTGNPEIDGYNRNTLMFKFMNSLENKGYVALGAGAYGCVMTHPGIPYAIKIFQDDPAYLAYVRFALANQDNPHVPRFRGKFMKIDDRHYVVRIELLETLEQSVRQEVAATVIAYGDREIYPEDLDEHQQLLDSYPQLPPAMEGIIGVCRSNRARLDVYSQSNIMSRNGVPVFTDPVAPSNRR